MPKYTLTRNTENISQKIRGIKIPEIHFQHFKQTFQNMKVKSASNFSLYMLGNNHEAKINHDDVSRYKQEIYLHIAMAKLTNNSKICMEPQKYLK